MEKITKEIWDGLLIVFDTSALCKMYDMTDSAKKTMVEVLDYFKDRIFIPGHVLTEYHKNRLKVIYNPLKERYVKPDCFNNTELKDKGRPFIKQLCNKNYYHPFISDASQKRVNEELEKAIEALSRISDVLKKEKDERNKEISKLKENDIIRDMIHSLNCGTEFSFDDMLKISEKGEFRYRHSIPPGYKDDKEKNVNGKTGIDKFGDLFVWQQILAEANKGPRNVLFLCNDEKIDWWEDYKKKVLRPELIKEFHDFTGKNIFATSLEGFIAELENRYKEEGTLEFYEGLEAVKDVLDYYSHFSTPGMTEDDVYAMLKCKDCGKVTRVVLDDLDFWWDEDSWSEREMGTEFGYRSSQYFSCDHCKNDMELEFRLYEYPAGRIETCDIEESDCEIENDPNWMRVIQKSFHQDAHKCLYCGRWVHELTNDMCDECLDEFKRKMQED